MKARFYFEGGQPKVEFNGEWNSLSLFLESDASFTDVKNHIELKKQRKWIGNISIIHLLSGSQFEIYSDLLPELKSVKIFRKKLLFLMQEFEDFQKNKKEKIIEI